MFTGNVFTVKPSANATSPDVGERPTGAELTQASNARTVANPGSGPSLKARLAKAANAFAKSCRGLLRAHCLHRVQASRARRGIDSEHQPHPGAHQQGDAHRPGGDRGGKIEHPPAEKGQ